MDCHSRIRSQGIAEVLKVQWGLGSKCFTSPVFIWHKPVQSSISAFLMVSEYQIGIQKFSNILDVILDEYG